jgi:hypothetical protein
MKMNSEIFAPAGMACAGQFTGFLMRGADIGSEQSFCHLKIYIELCNR